MKCIESNRALLYSGNRVVESLFLTFCITSSLVYLYVTCWFILSLFHCKYNKSNSFVSGWLWRCNSQVVCGILLCTSRWWRRRLLVWIPVQTLILYTNLNPTMCQVVSSHRHWFYAWIFEFDQKLLYHHQKLMTFNKIL